LVDFGNILKKHVVRDISMESAEILGS